MDSEEKPIEPEKKTPLKRIPIIRYLLGLDHSDRLSLLALLISLFSVVMGTIQFKETQSQFKIQQDYDHLQDQLSVRPIVGVGSLSSGKLQGNESGSSPGLYMVNSGFGPAKITSMRFEYDGNLFTNSHELGRCLFDEGHFALRKYIRWMYTTTGPIDSDFYLPPNQRSYFLSVHDSNIIDYNGFNKLITKDIGIEIQYESIYNEKFVYRRNIVINRY